MKKKYFRVFFHLGTSQFHPSEVIENMNYVSLFFKVPSRWGGWGGRERVCMCERETDSNCHMKKADLTETEYYRGHYELLWHRPIHLLYTRDSQCFMYLCLWFLLHLDIGKPL